VVGRNDADHVFGGRWPAVRHGGKHGRRSHGVAGDQRRDHRVCAAEEVITSRRRKMSNAKASSPSARVSRRAFLHATTVIPAALASSELLGASAAGSTPGVLPDLAPAESCDSPLPLVEHVPLQPLVAQVKRLITAAEYLGTPLAPDRVRELETAFTMADE